MILLCRLLVSRHSIEMVDFIITVPTTVSSASIDWLPSLIFYFYPSSLCWSDSFKKVEIDPKMSKFCFRRTPRLYSKQTKYLNTTKLVCASCAIY